MNFLDIHNHTQTVIHYFHPPDQNRGLFEKPISLNRQEIIIWAQPMDVSFLSQKLQSGHSIVLLSNVGLDFEQPDEFDFLKHPSVTIVCSQLDDYKKLLPCKSEYQLYFDPAKLPYLTKQIILLMRDQKRVSHVQNKLLNFLTNSQVFPATDAQTPGSLDTFLEKNGIQIGAFMKAGLVGCFCSHYRVWESLLKESDDPAWIVLEDDVVPLTDSKGVFVDGLKNLLHELPSTFDLVYLYLSPQYYRNDNRVCLPGKKYLNQAYSNSNSSAYLISRRGARKLLDYCQYQSLTDSVDQVINRIMETENFEAYSAKYLLFDNMGLKATQLKQELQAAKLSSNIDNSKVYRPATPNHHPDHHPDHRSPSTSLTSRFLKSLFY